MKQFAVYLSRLDPTEGAEMRKTRPCVIVSPPSMIRALKTVIIVPMSRSSKGWPSRVPVTFRGDKGEIVLDQIRTVDKARLGRRLGELDEDTATLVCNRLREIFHPRATTVTP